MKKKVISQLVKSDANQVVVKAARNAMNACEILYNHMQRTNNTEYETEVANFMYEVLGPMIRGFETSIKSSYCYPSNGIWKLERHETYHNYVLYIKNSDSGEYLTAEYPSGVYKANVDFVDGSKMVDSLNEKGLYGTGEAAEYLNGLGFTAIGNHTFNNDGLGE